jgi:hypothetical protein
MEEFFICQQQIEQPFFPAHPVLPDQLRTQFREDLIMLNPAGAVYHTGLTEETGHEDLFEPFRKVQVSLEKVFGQLYLSPGARFFHEKLLVNGAGRDTKSTLIAAISYILYFLQSHHTTPNRSIVLGRSCPGLRY